MRKTKPIKEHTVALTRDESCMIYQALNLRKAVLQQQIAISLKNPHFLQLFGDTTALARKITKLISSNEWND